jgi:hypothetical protein
VHFSSIRLALIASVAALPRGSVPAGTAPAPALAPQAQTVPIGMQVLPALARARDVGPEDPDRVLDLSVSLSPARPRELEAFVDAVSDPRSPEYRRFLAPEQVGERFGRPLAEVEEVADYLRGMGASVGLVAKNRMGILATIRLSRAEAAFHTSIRRYRLDQHDVVEPGEFLANRSEVRLPPRFAGVVVDVGGLETYTRPQRRMTLLDPTLTHGLYGTSRLIDAGSTGTGRTIGVSSFDGFRSADWITYVQHFGLPVPPGGAGSNVTVVPVNGGGLGAGPTHFEGDLDIQMELGAAPLANIRVYDSPPNFDLIAVLTAEANENLCDVISDSYGWQLGPTLRTAAHNQHLAMSAQGITYMAASGDAGTLLDPYSYPDYEPEVLLVGGTTADVAIPSGRRFSEVAWAGSGGGWSINPAPFNVRPPWQTGAGVPPVTPTTDHRLVPDVAFHSAGVGWGAYQFYSVGQLRLFFDGTSFASPMFAGSLALVEQEVIHRGGLPPDAAGNRRFGRIQDLVYRMNGRPDVWHDITSGQNGMLPDGTPSVCSTGWDTVTGWGPMDCRAFAIFAACETGGACSPGTPYCAGDGLDPNVTTPCACSNTGAEGRGCGNSASARGALLSAMGESSPDSVVLTAYDTPASAVALFLQGDASASAGVTFGAGILCAGGHLRVLYTKVAGNGVAAAPTGGDAALRARSAALGDVIPSGATRYYQVGYRDPVAGFCPPNSTNVTNGYAITWP